MGGGTMNGLSISRPDVDFLITNGCPNHCRHCVFESGERLAYEMDTREVVEALCRIKERFGAHWISLSGGEPFCRPDFSIIYREASRLFKVTLISSGAGATEEIRRLLAEVPPAQAISSLYGLGDKHDAFSRKTGAYAAQLRHLEFLSGLRPLAEIQIAVNIVCHRGNAKDVPGMIEFLAEQHLVDEVKLLALSPVGRGSELLDACMSGEEWIAFADRVRRSIIRQALEFEKGVRVERHVAATGQAGGGILGCHIVRDQSGAFSSCVHVDADGEIYPCTLLVRRQEFRLGNIRDPGGFALERYYDWVREAWSGFQDGCRSRCELGGDCPGGCLGYHLALGRDYRCEGRNILCGCPDRYEVLVPGKV